MKLFLWLLIPFVLSGCHQSRPQKSKAISKKKLSHFSQQLLIEGWSETQVYRTFGEPHKVEVTTNFLPARQPQSVPKFNTLWTYYLNMGQIVIAFKNYQVVFAVEEYSDW